jgi:2C-methyl-D-erythritol 2,4-cyclodiphosphate synthase
LGHHAFPDDKSENEDISSSEILSFVYQTMSSAGYEIVNVDATKLIPYFSMPDKVQ